MLERERTHEDAGFAGNTSTKSFLSSEKIVLWWFAVDKVKANVAI